MHLFCIYLFNINSVIAWQFLGVFKIVVLRMERKHDWLWQGVQALPNVCLHWGDATKCKHTLPIQKQLHLNPFSDQFCTRVLLRFIHSSGGPEWYDSLPLSFFCAPGILIQKFMLITQYLISCWLATEYMSRSTEKHCVWSAMKARWYVICGGCFTFTLPVVAVVEWRTPMCVLT